MQSDLREHILWACRQFKDKQTAEEFTQTLMEMPALSPSPTPADVVVEACAQLVEVRLTTLLTRDSEVGRWLHRLDGDAIREIAAAIRALKGTFPAAPEAKSDVAGWVVLRKRGDGIFMSAETYDEASAAAEADIHDRGYFAVTRVRSALVDPEGGV